MVAAAVVTAGSALYGNTAAVLTSDRARLPQGVGELSGNGMTV